MNKIIFVGATLAIFALPGAFGLMCYNCTAMAPYGNSNELCMNSSAYKKVDCPGAPNCTTVMIMVNNVLRAYSAGCVPANSNCTFYNENVCNDVIEKGKDHNVTVTCSAECCQGKNCNMPDPPTTPPTSTTETSGNNSTTEAPSAGVEFLAPKVIALLAAYLSALYFGKQ